MQRNSPRSLLSCALLILSSFACRDQDPQVLLGALFDDSELAIRIVNPARGAIWLKGESYIIRWENVKPYSAYDLYLYSGSTSVRTVALDIRDTSNFTWEVPTSLVDDVQYRIRIIGHDPDITMIGQSDPFAILAQ